MRCCAPQGPWNHAFYLLLDGALPPTPDPFTLTTLGKVGIDQFIQACAAAGSRPLCHAMDLDPLPWRGVTVAPPHRDRESHLGRLGPCPPMLGQCPRVCARECIPHLTAMRSPPTRPIFTMIILCFFAVVEGKGLEFAKNQITNELGGILLKNWAIFLPATAINLAYCPPELRVLFLNCAPRVRMRMHADACGCMRMHADACGCMQGRGACGGACGSGCWGACGVACAGAHTGLRAIHGFRIVYC